MMIFLIMPQLLLLPIAGMLSDPVQFQDKLMSLEVLGAEKSNTRRSIPHAFAVNLQPLFRVE